MKSNLIGRYENTIDAAIRLAKSGQIDQLLELIEVRASHLELIGFDKPYGSISEILAANGCIEAVNAHLKSNKDIAEEYKTIEYATLWGYILGNHDTAAHTLAKKSSNEYTLTHYFRSKTIIEAYLGNTVALKKYTKFTSDFKKNILSRHIADVFYGLGLGNQRALFDELYTGTVEELNMAVRGAAHSGNVEFTLYLLKEKDKDNNQLDTAIFGAISRHNQALLIRLINEDFNLSKKEFVERCIDNYTDIIEADSVNTLFHHYPDYVLNYLPTKMTMYKNNDINLIELLAFIDDDQLRASLLQSVEALGSLDLKKFSSGVVTTISEALIMLKIMNRAIRELNCSYAYAHEIYSLASSKKYLPHNYSQLSDSDQQLQKAIAFDSIPELERALANGAQLKTIYKFMHCSYGLTHYAVYCGAIQVLKHLNQKYHLSLEPLPKAPNSNLLYVSILLDADLRKPILEWFNEGENYKKLGAGITKGHVLSALGISNSKDKAADNMGLIRQDYACFSGYSYNNNLEHLDIFRIIQHGELKQLPIFVLFHYIRESGSSAPAENVPALAKSLVKLTKNVNARIDMSACYPNRFSAKLQDSIFYNILLYHSDLEFVKSLLRHSVKELDLNVFTTALPNISLDKLEFLLHQYPKQPFLLCKKEDETTYQGCLANRLLGSYQRCSSNRSLEFNLQSAGLRRLAFLKEVWQRNKKLGIHEFINLNSLNISSGPNHTLAYSLAYCNQLELFEEMLDLNPQIVDLKASSDFSDGETKYENTTLVCLLAHFKEKGIELLRKLVKLNQSQVIDLNLTLSKCPPYNNTTLVYLLAKEKAFDLIEHFFDLNPVLILNDEINTNPKGRLNEPNIHLLQLFAEALKSSKPSEHAEHARNVLKKIFLPGTDPLSEKNSVKIEAGSDLFVAYKKLLESQTTIIQTENGSKEVVNAFITSEFGRQLLKHYYIDMPESHLNLIANQDKKENTASASTSASASISATTSTTPETNITKFINLCKANSSNISQPTVNQNGNKIIIGLTGNKEILTQLAAFIKSKKKTAIKNLKDLPGKIKYVEIEDGEGALNTLLQQFASQITAIITKTSSNHTKTQPKQTNPSPMNTAAPGQVLEKPYKDLNEMKQQEWEKDFHTAFFHANVITTHWNQENKCFSVSIKEAKTIDIEVTGERKTDQPISYRVSKEFFDKEITLRILRYIEKCEEKGEVKFIASSGEFKIYPYAEESLKVKSICEQINKKLQDEMGKSVKLKQSEDATDVITNPPITNQTTITTISQKTDAHFAPPQNQLTIAAIEALLNPKDEIKTSTQLFQFSLAPTNQELLNAVNKLCEKIVSGHFKMGEIWNFLTIDQANDGKIILKHDCVMKQTVNSTPALSIFQALKLCINTILPGFVSIDVNKNNSNIIKIKFSVAKTIHKNSHIALALIELSDHIDTLLPLFSGFMMQTQVTAPAYEIQQPLQETMPDLILKKITNLFAIIAKNYIDEDQTWDFLEKQINIFKRRATFKHNTGHASTFKTIPCIEIYQALQKSINHIKPNCMRIKSFANDMIIFSIHMENNEFSFIKQVEHLFKPDHLKQMQDKFNEGSQTFTNNSANMTNIDLATTYQKTKELIQEKDLTVNKSEINQNDNDHLSQVATPLQKAAIHYFYLKQFEKGELDSADDHLTLDNIQYHLLFLVKNLIANYAHLNVDVQSANYKKQYKEWKNVRQILAHMSQLKAQFTEKHFFSFDQDSFSLASLIIQKYKQLSETLQLRNSSDAITFAQNPIYQQLFGNDPEGQNKFPTLKHAQGGQGLIKDIVHTLESIAPIIATLQMPQYLYADLTRRDAIKWRLLQIGDLVKQLRNQEFIFCKQKLKSNLSFVTYDQDLLQKLKSLTNITIQPQVKTDGSQYELILPFLRVLEFQGKAEEIDTIINSLTLAQKLMLMIEVRNTLAHDPKYIVTVLDNNQYSFDVSKIVNANDIEPIIMVTMTRALLKDLPELNSLSKFNTAVAPNSSSTFQFSGNQNYPPNPKAMSFETKKKY